MRTVAFAVLFLASIPGVVAAPDGYGMGCGGEPLLLAAVGAGAVTVDEDTAYWTGYATDPTITIARGLGTGVLRMLVSLTSGMGCSTACSVYLTQLVQDPESCALTGTVDFQVEVRLFGGPASTYALTVS